MKQKLSLLTLLTFKAREGMAELSSYISQCLFEKHINRHFYADNHEHAHGKKVGVLVNGIGGLLIESIFKAFEDIEGGKVAAKLSFGRVLETLMEHLNVTRCTFSVFGARKLLGDFKTLLKWAEEFDEVRARDPRRKRWNSVV